MDEKKYWFKRKRYGWGWVPITWQGWLVIAIHVGVLLGLAFWIFDGVEEGSREETERGFIYIGAVILATTIMLRLVSSKSPPGKWRWGKSKDDDPNLDF